MKKEIRVYVVECYILNKLELLQEDFMTMAEAQGNVFTLGAFEDYINNSNRFKIGECDAVRFIEVEYYE